MPFDSLARARFSPVHVYHARCSLRTATQAALDADRLERASIRTQNANTVGSKALPRGSMDLSAGTTQGDLGKFTQPPPAQSMARRLSATRLGTDALPRSPMDLSAGTTQGDLGKFALKIQNQQGELFSWQAPPAQSMARRLSATRLGTDALPQSPMDLSAGTTQRDLGNFTQSPPAQSMARRLSATRLGTDALPQSPMDLSAGTTQGDLGRFEQPPPAQSMARRLSATNLGTAALPRDAMNLSAGTTQRDLGSWYNGYAK